MRPSPCTSSSGSRSTSRSRPPCSARACSPRPSGSSPRLAIASLVAAFVVGCHQRGPGADGPDPRPAHHGLEGRRRQPLRLRLLRRAVRRGRRPGRGILIAFRDADPEAEAQVVRAESVPLTRAPAGNNYLPGARRLRLRARPRRPGQRQPHPDRRRPSWSWPPSPSPGPCGPGPSGPPATTPSTPSSTTASSTRCARPVVAIVLHRPGGARPLPGAARRLQDRLGRRLRRCGRRVLRGRRPPGAVSQVHQDHHDRDRGLRSARHPGRRLVGAFVGARRRAPRRPAAGGTRRLRGRRTGRHGRPPGALGAA